MARLLSFIFISAKQYLPVGSIITFPKSIFNDCYIKTATPLLLFSPCEKKQFTSPLILPKLFIIKTKMGFLKKYNVIIFCFRK